MEMCEFLLILYIKPWFLNRLAVSAAITDLDFMSKVMKFCLRKPVLAWHLLQSAKLHLWYLTPQMVILALVDEKIEAVEREKIARALHASPRKAIELGKPSVMIWWREAFSLPRNLSVRQKVKNRGRHSFKLLNTTEHWCLPAS